MRLSIRNRFLIPTLVLIIIGMGVTTIISYVNMKGAVHEAYEGQIVQLAQSTGKFVVSWISDRRQDIATWSTQKMFSAAVQGSSTDNNTAREDAGRQMNYPAASYGVSTTDTRF